MEQTRFDREVDQNYEVFLAQVDSLLDRHSGQFVLMREGTMTDFFPTAVAALEAGRDRYSDGLFSIQEITTRPVDLGFFSHAIDTRIA